MMTWQCVTCCDKVSWHDTGWGWWFNAVTGRGWWPLLVASTGATHHRVLVTCPRPGLGPGQSRPALGIIDLRQLRLWLRVTRHRLLVLAPWQEPLVSSSERGWQSTQSPGPVTPNRYRAIRDTLYPWRISDTFMLLSIWMYSLQYVVYDNNQSNLDDCDSDSALI